MLRALLYLFSLCFLISSIGCKHDHNHSNDHSNDHDTQEHHEHDHEIDEGGFDQKLADELGADQFGMSTYVIAFLKEGPNRSQDSVTAAEMQRAHLDNINRLAEEGTLVLAGPFYEEGPLRGIYIFDVETIEEAEALTKSDPMIQEGRLVMELKRWYGSAAVKMIGDWHSKIAKEEI